MPTAKKEMQRKRHFMKGFELPSEPDEDEDFGVGGQRDPGRGKMDIEVEEIVQYESKQSEKAHKTQKNFYIFGPEVETNQSSFSEQCIEKHTF